MFKQAILVTLLLMLITISVNALSVEILPKGHHLYYTIDEDLSESVIDSTYKTACEVIKYLDIPSLKDSKIYISRYGIKENKLGYTNMDHNICIIIPNDNKQKVTRTVLHEIGHLVESNGVSLNEYSRYVHKTKYYETTNWFDSLQEDFAEDFLLYAAKKLKVHVDPAYKKTYRPYKKLKFTSFIRSELKHKIKAVPTNERW
jgi:Zn-dependent peptidase ImmA (M78 family)